MSDPQVAQFIAFMRGWNLNTFPPDFDLVGSVTKGPCQHLMINSRKDNSRNKLNRRPNARINLDIVQKVSAIT